MFQNTPPTPSHQGNIPHSQPEVSGIFPLLPATPALPLELVAESMTPLPQHSLRALSQYWTAAEHRLSDFEQGMSRLNEAVFALAHMRAIVSYLFRSPHHLRWLT